MTNELEPQRTSLNPDEIHSHISEWMREKVEEKSLVISEFDRPTGSGI